MRRPVNSPYTITTEFGEPDSNALYRFHSGVDYAVPSSTPVYATTAGRIVYAQFHSVRGNMVVLFDGRFYHRFMHNSRFNVAVGQQVNEGDVLAYSGTTGLSTGPHVHWDINTNGVDTTSFSQFINPADWLAGTYQPAPQGDNDMITRKGLEFVFNQVLGRNPDDSAYNHYVGNYSFDFVIDDVSNSQEARTRRQQQADAFAARQKQFEDLQAALANEQNKPPREVIKTVTQIVEKPVEVVKEVPVYTHDQKTANEVSSILKIVKTIQGMVANLFKKK